MMVYPRHHPHGSPPGVASLPAGASACPRPPFFSPRVRSWCPCILTSGTLLNDICHPLTYIISRVRFPCVRCPLAILVCSSSKFHDRGPSSITVSPFCTSAPAPNEQLTSARPHVLRHRSHAAVTRARSPAYTPPAHPTGYSPARALFIAYSIYLHDRSWFPTFEIWPQTFILDKVMIYFLGQTIFGSRTANFGFRIQT